MSEVSVIIPTYNRARFLLKAIDSVFAQKYEDFEVIVVDDGSTDDTKEILKTYLKKISYIYQKNSGVSSARNAGIRVAKGEWVAFLDSDDEWLPEKLAVQMNFVASHPFIIAHSVNIDLSDYDIDSQTSFSHCKFTPMKEEGIIEKPFLHHFRYRTTMMPSGVICKKKAAIQAGLFDESLSICEDYDFMSRLALQGSWGFSSDILAVMHKRDENIQRLSATRSIDKITTCRSLIKSHSKLLSEECLNNNDKEAISKLLSSNYRMLGQLLSKQGSFKESSEAFGKAYKIKNSFKSLIWYVFSKFPGSILQRVVNLRKI